MGQEFGPQLGDSSATKMSIEITRWIQLEGMLVWRVQGHFPHESGARVGMDGRLRAAGTIDYIYMASPAWCCQGSWYYVAVHSSLKECSKRPKWKLQGFFSPSLKKHSVSHFCHIMLVTSESKACLQGERLHNSMNPDMHGSLHARIIFGGSIPQWMFNGLNLCEFKYHSHFHKKLC